MSSLELVDIINSLRPEGTPEIRHDNLMRKIENHPGIASPQFLGHVQIDIGNGAKRKSKCYHLPKRECELLVMAESLEVQTKVYDRMVELEQLVRLGSLQQPVLEQAVALTLSHKQVKDLELVLRHAEMTFDPHEDSVDREFVIGKFQLLSEAVRAALPQTHHLPAPAQPTAAAPDKPSDIPDLHMIAGGYYALIRNIPCLRIGDDVFLALSSTCHAVGIDPSTYFQSAKALPDSFLAHLPFRDQTRKALMVPINFWEAKLGRTRMRQPARAQLGGLLQEVRSGLFATIH